jgi:small subunit ribosomal protein S1
MTDNTSDHESFADLFNDDTITNKRLAPGQKIKARVVDVSQDSIFLDVGKKSEGFLDRKELEDETGTITVKAGDTLEVYLLSTTHNETTAASPWKVLLKKRSREDSKLL